MNQFECMRMYVKVVEHAGFSKAAIALQMSPAKVSTQISNLEKHLGVQLLSRTTRTCALTDDGESYYAHCKRVLADIDQTEALLGRSRGTPQGRLRVDAPVTFINRLLLPVLGAFRARYPEIDIEMLHTPNVFDVQPDGLDVMLRMGPLRDSGLIARQLGSTVMVTAAAPAYLARCGEPKTPHDLLKHQCINYLDCKTGRVFDWKFERSGEVIELTPAAGLSFNQGESRLAAAVMGLGIYRGIRLNLDRLLAAGALKLILQDWVTPAPPIYIAYEHHRHLSSRVRAFVDFMVGCYPAGKPIDSLASLTADPLQMRA
jgi:LysR family transcriptional regulator for bpeEF and oprC